MSSSAGEAGAGEAQEGDAEAGEELGGQAHGGALGHERQQAGRGAGLGRLSFGTWRREQACGQAAGELHQGGVLVVDGEGAVAGGAVEQRRGRLQAAHGPVGVGAAGVEVDALVADVADVAVAAGEQDDDGEAEGDGDERGEATGHAGSGGVRVAG
ncbi:hypothetical protein [Nannocystis pusilla]|uniref:hypothetical protein n=1 Tax=Nannocystis pusilla TaxID=889268 RepID=UPI003DA225DD